MKTVSDYARDKKHPPAHDHIHVDDVGRSKARKTICWKVQHLFQSLILSVRLSMPQSVFNRAPSVFGHEAEQDAVKVCERALRVVDRVLRQFIVYASHCNLFSVSEELTEFLLMT